MSSADSWTDAARVFSSMRKFRLDKALESGATDTVEAGDNTAAPLVSFGCRNDQN
jgi:hypothetical protein